MNIEKVGPMNKKLPHHKKSKKLYISPTFKEFGSVKSLTQAGSVGPSEGQSGHTDKAPKP